MSALPLNQIICGDNCDVLGTLPRDCIDLVVTSPPYDDLRTYGGHSWDFYGVAWQLKRVLKPGGVIVWVVADATKDGSESGTSMEQALHFKRIGLNLHDTMIWHAPGGGAKGSNNAYWQSFEFMFVLSRGTPAAINRIADQPCSEPGHLQSPSNRSLSRLTTKRMRSGEVGIRQNLWIYNTIDIRWDDGGAHPAKFPEDLARDHIRSWSKEGDIVLDPFSGSGTTAKMARELGRHYIGIEINPDYCEISKKRLSQQLLPLE
jgi:DNA modification methylase